jgi:hypothetical protein
MSRFQLHCAPASYLPLMSCFLLGAVIPNAAFALQEPQDATVDTGSANTTSADQAAIKQLFAERVESFNARDLKRQLSLFTDDTTYHSSTGKLSVSGREDLGLLLLAAWNGPMSNTTLSEEIVRVQFLNAEGLPATELPDRAEKPPGVAIVEFEIAFHAPEESAISYDELRGVRVLVKRDGTWRIHTSCQTPFDPNATLTPDRFAEIKENYRAEYRRQVSADQ